MGHKRVFQPVISIDLIFPSSFLHKKLDMTDTTLIITLGS
jgi:hypothetical protein